MVAEEAGAEAEVPTAEADPVPMPTAECEDAIISLAAIAIQAIAPLIPITNRLKAAVNRA